MMISKEKCKFLKDNEWFLVEVPQNGFKLRCCDCGLVHQMDFSVEENQEHKKDPSKVPYFLSIRARRDKRATAQVRRWFNVT